MPQVSLVSRSVQRQCLHLITVAMGFAGFAAPAHAQNPPLYKTLAGKSPAGRQDGIGEAARFNQPSGIVVDAAGNLFVADSMNCAIRKITPAGNVSTFVGGDDCGVIDGDASTAELFGPLGIAIDATGNLYVSESSNTIRKITPAGVVTTLAGTAFQTGATDGTGPAARFNTPRGITADSSGNLFVADTFSQTIRKITAAGVVTTIAGMANAAGTADGNGAAARFRAPSGIAVDGSGNLYVADSNNHVLRKIEPDGDVTTLAGLAQTPGGTDGTGSNARFAGLQGVAVDGSGTIFVADTFSSTIRQVTPANVVTTIAGAGGNPGDVDGTGSAAQFYNPFAIAVGPGGTLYVADTNNANIRKITAGGVVTTIAGFRGSVGSADGFRSRARFESPIAAASDAAGNVYVADRGNFTIRKITPWGLVSTFAGLAGTAGHVDGVGSAARFGGPRGVVLDAAGNLYVVDSISHTIRKITPAGEVTTLAGSSGSTGTDDGVGSTARFNGPNSIAIDGTGLLYVTDSNNHTIRTVTTTGTVATYAGGALQQGATDGTTAAARFRSPRGVAVDAGGNVYVADTNNNTVRKISGGMVTTLAGLAQQAGGFDGVGSAARFNGPQGIAVGGDGTIYVADTNNHTIRQVTQAGAVTTVGGAWGAIGADDGYGTGARFNSPTSIAIDSHGVLIVSDTRNNTVRTTGSIRSNRGDFDLDGKADPAVFRPSSGTWFALNSGGVPAQNAYNWGSNGDVPVAGDFDGDGKTDPAIFRPSNGQWWILTSSSGYVTYFSRTWGGPSDIPGAADWDGDTIADIGIFRPSSGEWYVLLSTANFNDYGSIVWGSPGDVAVPADYDGDGAPDVAIYRPSNGQWWILPSSEDYDYSEYFATTWGVPGDTAVPADYDGDGRADIAVFRPSNGTWYALTSSSNFTSTLSRTWGVAGDVPVPADYDGDGKTDFAIYRPSTGQWFVLKSSTNYADYSAHNWGTTGDVPVLKR